MASLGQSQTAVAVCLILGIPQEVRDMIYTEVFLNGSGSATVDATQPFGILAVSKQIHVEAKATLIRLLAITPVRVEFETKAPEHVRWFLRDCPHLILKTTYNYDFQAIQQRTDLKTVEITMLRPIRDKFDDPDLSTDDASAEKFYQAVNFDVMEIRASGTAKFRFVMRDRGLNTVHKPKLLEKVEVIIENNMAGLKQNPILAFDWLPREKVRYCSWHLGLLEEFREPKSDSWFEVVGQEYCRLRQHKEE